MTPGLGGGVVCDGVGLADGLRLFDGLGLIEVNDGVGLEEVRDGLGLVEVCDGLGLRLGLRVFDWLGEGLVVFDGLAVLVLDGLWEGLRLVDVVDGLELVDDRLDCGELDVPVGVGLWEWRSPCRPIGLLAT